MSSEIHLQDGVLTLALADATEAKTSPYLAWHLEQATGWSIQIEQLAPLVPEIPAPLPLAAKQEFAEPDESQTEFEYVREEWSPSSDEIGWDQSTHDVSDVIQSSSAPLSKRPLGLRARLDRLVQESREPAPDLSFEPEIIEDIFVSDEEPIPQDSKTDKKRLSIQERMRAIKAESLRGSPAKAY